MPRPESQKVVNMTVLSTVSCRFLSFVLLLKSMNDHKFCFVKVQFEKFLKKKKKILANILGFAFFK